MIVKQISETRPAWRIRQTVEKALEVWRRGGSAHYAQRDRSGVEPAKRGSMSKVRNEVAADEFGEENGSAAPRSTRRIALPAQTRVQREATIERAKIDQAVL